VDCEAYRTRSSRIFQPDTPSSRTLHRFELAPYVAGGRIASAKDATIVLQRDLGYDPTGCPVICDAWHGVSLHP
jgi:hypothetical protein